MSWEAGTVVNETEDALGAAHVSRMSLMLRKRTRKTQCALGSGVKVNALRSG
jgi:hypothetical protein